MELNELTIRKAVEAIKDREVSAVELTRHYLSNIKEKDGEIDAYLEVFSDAIESASAVDKKIKNGEKTGILAGIPLAIKDNIMIEGRRASSASKILEGYRATFDATAIAKLRSEGAVFLGRTNMDEFAMGSSTENSAYKTTKNPHDVSRVPGGSSGGSAAAVAGKMALAALGSDTGGSVRQPAALCGVVGFKPTYGAVSRHGLMAMGSSLDQIGPITKTVEDAKIIFDVMRGKDAMDSTSCDAEELGRVDLRKNRKIGVPGDFLNDGVSGDVMENFKSTLSALEKEGYEIVNISLPNIGYSLPVYYIIMPAEVSTNLSRFDGVRYGLSKKGDDLLSDYMKTRGSGFGKEARRRIILGTHVLSSGYYDAYYKKAEAVRGLIRSDFRKIFSGDNAPSAIVTPTTPDAAFKVGEKTSDPLKMYLGDIFTVTANIAGIPAISVPSGTVSRDGKKLPVGFQIMGPWGEEETLFGIGKDVEKLSNI